MWLRLCIILAVLRTGLKVNVMHITLHEHEQHFISRIITILYENTQIHIVRHVVYNKSGLLSESQKTTTGRVRFTIGIIRMYICY